ncbi:hypothetical protein [Streptomyces endophytica]|uniref:Uncharacterized protein n=1 Tax=Streptomyces endophytica TaxID=2991496 RepID=A0ABY6PB00_9ACTN|nr:hypothetical protein [Streptomyces endophytica]UZJ30999.1 hypothetical protein OJ254_12435 [Streptomyces endophytica]
MGFNPTETVTAEQAYANAPHLVAEIASLTAVSADPEAELGREWYLRHAALLDRVALRLTAFDDEPGIATAVEEAEASAVYLLDTDKAGDGNYGGTPYWPEHPAAEANPRGYVRQEYTLWAAAQMDDPWASTNS